MSKSVILRTEEVLRTAYSKNTDQITFSTSEHALIYVARGYIDVFYNGHLVATAKEKEAVFVQKDRRLSLVRYPSEETGKQFSVMLRFPRNILFEFYKTLPEEDLPAKKFTSLNRHPVIKHNFSPMLSSLFDAFKPFWRAGDHPDNNWLKMKVLEGVRYMSHVDKVAYALLFDFAARWRLDIMAFMEKNYMYELTVAEMANYTGRSVSTFKRDFAKLANMSPRNWLIRRRLQAAHEMIVGTTLPISIIMNDVGFKNFSHFSRAYRQLYGCTPTQSRNSYEPLSTIV